MEVGSVFDSYASFEDEFNFFCKEHNVCFTKRSSENIKDPKLEHLALYYIILCCAVNKVLNTACKDFNKTMTNSFKLGCHAKIKRVAQRNLSWLEITISMQEHTGHEVSKEMCSLYPENRKVELNVATHLVMSCTTIQASEVRKVLEQQHDVDLLARDIYNIKSRINQSSSYATETQSILHSISQAGGSVSYGLTESGEFKYLSYLTCDMINIIAQYPEVLLMNFTYETNK